MRILEIDGLRAIAMTMVIAQHCDLLPFGWTGVWLFFAISGYVITRGFLVAGDSGRDAWERFGDFMLRRFFRIVPVYVAYVAVNAAILIVLSGFTRLGDLPYLLTFTFNWHMIFGFWPGSSNWSPFGHLWTLSVEEQFYLFFPLIALFTPARARLPISLALIVAGPLVRYVYVGTISGLEGDAGWRAFAVYAASICHFDAFLMGSLVARFEPRIRAMPWISDALWVAATTCGIIYVVTYVQINRSLGASGIDAVRNVLSGILYGQQREVFGYVVVDLLASAALVHAILRRQLSRLLSSPTVTLVGRVSYGGYLFHPLAIWLMNFALATKAKDLPIGPRLLFFAAAWALTVTAAYASFRWFETPIAQWGRRLRRHRPAEPTLEIQSARRA